MKKILIIFSLLVSIKTFAQPKPEGWTKEKWDEARANKATRISLFASKSLLEANETTALVIKVFIPPKMDDDGNPLSLGEEMPLPTGDVMPYKIKNWRILEGGGNLIGVDVISASYTAPSSAPKNKTMTIAVSLEGTTSYDPNIELVKTLYFSENETSFVLDLPALGFNNTKFVSQNNGGIKVPTMANIDPRAAGSVSPELQAKMAQAQAAMAQAQASSGYNLQALSSNGSAIYDPNQDLTAIRLTNLNTEFMNGQQQNIVTQYNALVFSFKGKGVGSYAFAETNSGLGFSFPMQQKACGCGQNESGSSDHPCTGKVNITKVDDKTMEGDLSTVVYSSVGKNIVMGHIYGKFKVLRAN